METRICQCCLYYSHIQGLPLWEMLNKHASEKSTPPNKDIQKERNETACPRSWSKAETENSTDSLVMFTTLFMEDTYLLRW